MAPPVPSPPVLCDLDGVVWLAQQPIAGAAKAVALLRRHGHRVVFVTNNSSARIEDLEAALAAMGIAAVGDVLGSAAAAAGLVAAGERVLACAGPGVAQAVEARGAIVVHDGPCEVVMVGFHRTFDYDGLRRAASAVRGGARLIGTNDDPTYPTPDGPIPGGGSILAAVAVASGAKPVIAGKPHEAMAVLARTVLHDSALSDAVVVGDRADTDGLFARVLGARFALVETGVTAPGESVEPRPDLRAADLAAVADLLINS